MDEIKKLASDLWRFLQDARVAYSGQHASGTFRIASEKMERLQDALRSAQVPEWQPIETAPREGCFIVFMPGERRKMQFMIASENLSIIGDTFSFERQPPTYWMPAPAAPSAEGVPHA